MVLWREAQQRPSRRWTWTLEQDKITRRFRKVCPKWWRCYLSGLPILVTVQLKKKKKSHKNQKSLWPNWQIGNDDSVVLGGMWFIILWAFSHSLVPPHPDWLTAAAASPHVRLHPVAPCGHQSQRASGAERPPCALLSRDSASQWDPGRSGSVWLRRLMPCC